GHFLNLRGGRGTMMVEIRDPGETIHSALAISYICPVTGHGMRFTMDENTAHIMRQTAPDSLEHALIEVTGGVFPQNDVRYQSADKGRSTP
ncbi:MAG: hypothetical protein KJ667_09085, partial [Alphaproteobacteria bacterium]|nr:hypothetical protein [Alphaproteobacteria bacterium]